MTKSKNDNGNEEYCKGATKKQLIEEHIIKRFLKRDWEGLEAALITYNESLNPEFVQGEYNKVLHPNAGFVNRQKLLESITEIESHTGIKLNPNNSESLYFYALESPNSFSDPEFLKMTKKVTSIPIPEEKIQKKYNDLVTKVRSDCGNVNGLEEIRDIEKVTNITPKISDSAFKQGFLNILEKSGGYLFFNEALKKYCEIVRKDLSSVGQKWLNKHIKHHFTEFAEHNYYDHESILNTISSLKELGWKENSNVLGVFMESLMREKETFEPKKGYVSAQKIKDTYNIPISGTARTKAKNFSVRILKSNPKSLVSVYHFLKEWGSSFTQEDVKSIKMCYDSNYPEESQLYGALLDTMNNNLKKIRF